MLIIFTDRNDKKFALEAHAITRVGENEMGDIFVIHGGTKYVVQESFTTCVETINIAKLIKHDQLQESTKQMSARSNTTNNITDMIPMASYSGIFFSGCDM